MPSGNPRNYRLSDVILCFQAQGMETPGKPAPLKLKHARRVLRGLKASYPDAFCALTHASPFQLVAATILSAQCTDKKVNEVTPALFRRFPDAEHLARASQDELEQLIHQTGFFRAKAKSLIGMAQALVSLHGGEVPSKLVDLIQLPGVGRKTANVVLGTAFGVASGIVVDTHVKRLSFRLGLTDSVNPERVEKDLLVLLPRKEWIDFSHRMISHGRAVCLAQRPRCTACPLAKLCPRKGLTERS